MSNFVITVSDGRFVKDMEEVEAALLRVRPVIAEALVQIADEESAARNVEWHTMPGYEGIEADQWWAHFLAHGTRAHGPVTADRLLFQIDGEYISAASVAGISADPFDERTVLRGQARVREYITDAIRRA